MKNKKAEQAAARQQHITRLQEKKKQREVQPLLERTVLNRLVKPTILIVCEGKNTEPSYFNQFKLSSAVVKAVGKGYNTISLVKEAARLNALESYDQVWCVFDKDDFDAGDFNSAVAMATAQGFGVGYSNQAFEYWLLLHFEAHQGGGMHRNEYHESLNNYLEKLGTAYDGQRGKKIEIDFFELLLAIPDGEKISRTDLAISRAKQNYDSLEHQSPATEESSTTVFRLVEELLKYV